MKTTVLTKAIRNIHFRDSKDGYSILIIASLCDFLNKKNLIAERLTRSFKEDIDYCVEHFTSFSSIIDTLRNSIVDADNSLDELNSDIKTTSDSMANMRADQMEKVGQAIEDAVGDADRLTSGFKQINGGAQEAAQSMYSMTHQLEQLKTLLSL